MKFWTKFFAIGAVMTSTCLLADQSTPAPTNTPASRPVTKKPAPKKAAQKTPELVTVPLVPGPAVVSASRVNVRGQAKLKSEVITRMTNGEPVTVIEEIRLRNSGPEEPSAWAKIVLPEKVHVWVHGSYIDKATMTVIPKTLNIRGGPGENYSILGTLQKGDTVKEMRLKDNWIEIEGTTNVYAFMAAQYLTQEPLAVAAATPGEAAAVPENPTIAPTVTEPSVTDSNAVISAAMDTNAPVDMAAIEEPAPPPPRVVSHEGIVRPSISIQAPTIYELISADTRRPINYLYTTSTNLDLSRYKGLHIIVIGEEALDERWKNTPIITIRKIQVVE